MAVLELGREGMARDALLSPQAHSIVEWDLDELLLRGIDVGTARFVTRASKGRFSFEEVRAQGRVTAKQNKPLYDHRQDYYQSAWHLSRAKFDPDAGRALEAFSRIATNELLTGRKEHLRSTLERLFDRNGLSPFIAHMNLRGKPEGVSEDKPLPHDVYLFHKLLALIARGTALVVEHDRDISRGASSIGIPVALISDEHNQEVEETPFLQRFESLGTLAAAASRVSSLQEFTGRHYRKMVGQERYSQLLQTSVQDYPMFR